MSEFLSVWRVIALYLAVEQTAKLLWRSLLLTYHCVVDTAQTISWLSVDCFRQYDENGQVCQCSIQLPSVI